MPATATPPLDRVTDAVLHARADLTSVSSTPLWTLNAQATTAALDELLALEAQVAELQARVLAHADQLKTGDQTGATSTANWWGHHSTLTRREPHRQVRLAHSLETYDATRAALAQGRLHADQALVITHALDDLPESLDPTLVDQAETHLIAEAAYFDAVALNRIGRRLLEGVDPDAADAHEAQLLEREEREAAAACRLTLSEDGHGKVHGRFTLPAPHGRSRRCHSEAQRIAKVIEQGGRCIGDGCQTSTGLHIHHPVEWSKGGPTNRDGWLICPATTPEPTTPPTPPPCSPTAESPSTDARERVAEVVATARVTAREGASRLDP